MPEGAHILCVQVVKGQPVLYVRVEEDTYYVKKMIRIYGTGHECEVYDNYVGLLLLERAFQNTVELLKNNVEIIDE